MKNHRRKPLTRCAAYFLFLALLLVLPSCARSNSSGAGTSKIILITLDTTRADHLGCYGYKNIETPNLDRIASEGILFENATCQVPMTLPSHATILTGLYPPKHGIRGNIGYVLRDYLKTAAELLKDAGYRTGAAISAFVISSKFGMAQGFDSYNEDFEKPSVKRSIWVERRAKGTIDAAIDWFERNKSEEKLFFWLHLFDPHVFYDPPEPFKSQYKSHLYDGEIAYMDSELGRFFSYLKSVNIYDDAFFIIVGDHGESLGEHGESTHELFIYESTMKVPLIIKYKNFAGKKIRSLVSTVDIFPTIMDTCTIKDYGAADGKSLLPLVQGKVPAWNEEYYIESMIANLTYGWSQLKGVRKGMWKYIDCPEPELYNLENDPFEKNNSIGGEHEILQQLQGSLNLFDERWAHADTRMSAEKNIDNETLEKLTSLGYVGSSSTSLSNSKKDPKLYADVNETMNKAYLLLMSEDTGKGIDLLKDVLARDKENKIALYYLGLTYHDLKRDDLAMSYLEELIRLYPDYIDGYKRLINIYMEEKKLDKLRTIMEKIVEFFPDEAEFQYKYAIMLLSEQRIQDALQHIDKAIQLQPGQGFYYLLASKCYLMIGEKEKAVEMIEQADSRGYRDFSMLLKDPAFSKILHEPIIQGILRKHASER